MIHIDALKITNQLIEINQSVKDTYDQTEEDITFCDKAIQDIEHAIENTKFDVRRGFYLAKQLQDMRVKRRVAKDLKEQLQPLIELLKKNPNFFNEAKQVHAHIEITRNVQLKRTYKPRTDIQIAK